MMQIREINIRKMPGFDHGFTIDLLSSGVNLIYGPNASGKSTTARAIQGLLWPHTLFRYRPSLIGKMQYQGSDWMIELDTDRACYQCDGNTTSTLQGLPGADVKNRYYLSLHELLQDDNKSFVELILREAAGGYDVQSAGNALKYTNKVTAPKKLKTDLIQYQKDLNLARKEQQTLREEESQLQKWIEDRDCAKNAKNRAEWLQKAIEYKQACVEKREALTDYHGFPKGMQHLVGNEFEELEAIKESQEDTRSRICQTEQDITDIQERIAQCHLPETGVPMKQIIQLRKTVDVLKEKQHDIERLQREILAARETEESSKNRLDRNVEIESLEKLDSSALDEFIRFARKAEIHRANHLAREELKQWLGPIEDPPMLYQTKKGIDILVRWLNTADGNGRFHYLWFLLGAFFAGALISAGGVFMWSGDLFLGIPETYFLEGGFIAVGIGLLFWILHAHPNRRKRRELQNDYEELNLEIPKKWMVSNVQKITKNLQTAIAEMENDHDKATRWAHLNGRIQQLRQEWTVLNEQREQLLHTWGLPPIISVEALADAHFINMISCIVQWQQSHDRRVAKESEREHLQQQYSEYISHIQQIISNYSDVTLETPRDATAEIESLNARRETFEQATSDLHQFQTILEENRQKLVQLNQNYENLFLKVELTPGDEAGLHEYCRQYKSFTSAKDNLKYAEWEEKSKFDRLQSFPELREREVEDLQLELENQLSLASDLDTLNEKIGGITRAIDETKRKNDIEKAMTHVSGVCDQLRMERKSNYESVVGSLFVNEIEKANRSNNLPEVFHHATHIFSQITRGRYRLDIDHQTPPAFRAYDTALEKGQSLDELSSGTRLQILLAVRMAFVEKQEVGVKLPLLMDELLGNSDEAKAQTIIESVIELCNDGRQIFYFTAQHDEVGKWITMLENRNVPYQTIDLAQVRGFLESERLPKFELQTPARYHPPNPNGYDHAEYGKQLGVVELNPWEPIGGVHIWHFIDSPEVIYHLLEKGINRWGQLQNLVEQHGTRLVSENPRNYQRAELMNNIYEILSQCLKVGRGKTVDRAALIDSGAVSEIFMDDVVKLVTEFNGNAEEIIQALENKTISGFRQNKCQDLKQYFVNHGYLDERPSMSYEDISAQVLVNISTTDSLNRIDKDQVNAICHRIYSHWSETTK